METTVKNIIQRFRAGSVLVMYVAVTALHIFFLPRLTGVYIPAQFLPGTNTYQSFQRLNLLQRIDKAVVVKQALKGATIIPPAASLDRLFIAKTADAIALTNGCVVTRQVKNYRYAYLSLRTFRI